jgi:hypothetical protein
MNKHAKTVKTRFSMTVMITFKIEKADQSAQTNEQRKDQHVWRCVEMCCKYLSRFRFARPCGCCLPKSPDPRMCEMLTWQWEEPADP